jgi:hypothetical protein
MKGQKERWELWRLGVRTGRKLEVPETRMKLQAERGGVAETPSMKGQAGSWKFRRRG